ncbi:putative neural-cadherin 2 [Glandiceps talaboti]
MENHGSTRWTCSVLVFLAMIAWCNGVPPSFTETVYSTIIQEEDGDTPVQVLKVTATTNGDDQDSELWYSLQDTASHYFSISPRTGHIELIKPLDRDEKAVWHIVAMATTNDGRGESATADVIIGLSDINDKAPEFMHEPYIFTVDEESSPGTTVAVMTANDMDDPNADDDHVTLTYAIIQNAVVDDTDIFDIDSTTGEITVADYVNGTMRRETSSHYKIVVQAEDPGGHTGSSTATIYLLDTNNMTPMFTDELYYVELLETMDIGNTVYIVSALDNDLNSNLTFDIIEGDLSMFDIGDGPMSNAATITLAQVLNYTVQNSFNLTLQVSDGYHMNKAMIRMVLRDTNRNAPVFSPTTYEVSFLENTTIGTALGSVSATDDDTGMNGMLKYSINGTSDLFAIDADSGEITLQAEMDREMEAQHALQILAIDDGYPESKTGMATFTIQVLDVNDNAPMFADNYQPLVMENGAAIQHVANIHAMDADDDYGVPFTFELDASMTDMFYLNTTGEEEADIWTKQVFDRELQTFYYLPIVITDSGGLSATSTLTVEIEDVNDNPHAPGQKHIMAYQYKGRGSKVIGYVYSEDRDDKVASKNYTLLTETEYFSVDSDSGAITIMDKVMEGNYSLLVNVADDKYPSQHSTVSVMVKYIFEDAIYHSTMLGLYGTSADNFITMPGPGVKSPVQNLTESLSRILGVDENLVSILSVEDLTADMMNDMQVVGIESMHQMIGVRYHVRGYQAARLDAMVGANKDDIESDIGLSIVTVSVNPCSDESVCGGGSCTVVYSVNEKSETLLDSGPSAVALSLAINMGFECGCKTETCGMKSCDPLSCYNGGTCHNTDSGYRCMCPMGYSGPRCQDTKRSFSGDGYAWYEALETCEDFHLSLMFLTNDANGLLMYNGPMMVDSHISDFIAIGLRDGDVKLSIDLGGGIPLNVGVKSTASLDDGKWHSIDVYKMGKHVTLMVDKCMTSDLEEYPTYSNEDTSSCLISGMLEGNQTILNLNTALQLGGVFSGSGYSYPSSVGVDLSQGFTGCIRDLDIDGHTYHLGEPAQDMNSWHGCYGADFHCMDSNSNPICDHGECMADLWMAHCVCDPGYHGDDCSQETPEYTFGNNSHVTYYLGQNVDLSVSKISQYQLSFQTSRGEGTIWKISAAETREGKEYIHLRLSGGLVTVDYNIGDGDNTFMVDGVYVDDGEWHTVQLFRHRLHFKVKIDMGAPCRQVEYGVPNGYREFTADPNSLIIGAVEDGMWNFMGCVKDPRIGNVYIGLDGSTDGTTAMPSIGVSEGCKSGLCMENMEDQNPCNGSQSVCVETWNDYYCKCEDGNSYDEDNGMCEEIDHCEDDQCLNGAYCENGKASFTCNCTEGYLGDLCQYQSMCYNDNPCMYGGTCMDDGPFEYKCHCPTGLMGSTCTELDRCASTPGPCMNGGQCETIGDNQYRCICSYGYKGDNCETDDPCAPNQCRNGATCIPSSGSFTCKCTTGYTGSKCENFDHCFTSPCQNGGVCEVLENGYQCNCKGGWKGTTCTINDPCYPNPCKNSGTCTTLSNNDGFKCSCADDWEGITCENSAASSDSRTTGLIAAGCLLGLAAILLLGLIYYIYKNQNKYKQKKGTFDMSPMSTSAPIIADNGEGVYSIPDDMHYDNPLSVSQEEVADPKGTAL